MKKYVGFILSQCFYISPFIFICLINWFRVLDQFVQKNNKNLHKSNDTNSNRMKMGIRDKKKGNGNFIVMSCPELCFKINKQILHQQSFVL